MTFPRWDQSDFRRRQLYAQPENHAKIQKIQEVFRQVADTHDGTMVNAVIAWELVHPALTGCYNRSPKGE